MSGAAARRARVPILAFSQGDSAGIGPELLVRLLTEWSPASGWQPCVVAQLSALDAAVSTLSDEVRSAWPTARRRLLSGELPLLDPEGPIPESPVPEGPANPEGPEAPVFGQPSPQSARAALRAVDLALEEVRGGRADALVTLPVSKESIARWVAPSFRGHTEYLAERLGELRYGYDYLMTFLAPDLRVALLSTHLPLRQALDAITIEAVFAALVCLHRHGCRRLALAGLNPHAGEGGLLGGEETTILAPALVAARASGVDVAGPESPDTVFLRARRGEFDWVLALYHDQGLIAIKTVTWGEATNYTLGLPILRTSVDHGTAFGIAGRGIAEVAPLRAVVERTLELIASRRRESQVAP